MNWVADLGDAGSWIGNGAKKLWNGVTGHNDYQPGLHNIQQAPDADNPAIADYNRRKALYEAALQSTTPGVAAGASAGGPPAPPDANAISLGQIQGDRARILANQNNYGQLVSQLQQTAAGKGPSAALDTLREGGFRANAGAYGMAASADVAPGQRAALFNNAISQAGVNNQTTARDSAVMRANEMNTATGQLTSALAGAGDPLKALYQGDQEVSFRNQAAQQAQEDAKAGIASNNAQGLSKALQSGISGGAGMLQKSSGGG